MPIDCQTKRVYILFNWPNPRLSPLQNSGIFVDSLFLAELLFDPHATPIRLPKPLKTNILLV